MRTKYVCMTCEAVDYDRTMTPPVALDCHSCHAGRGTSLQEMVMRRVGMLPVETVDSHGEVVVM